MRILIIEDNKKLLSNLKEILEHYNYIVDAEESGKIGKQKIEENSYDLIILDLMLGDEDGISICKEARLKGINTPIIMLTARIDIESKIEGLETGADDYLTKPFHTRELLTRISVQLRKQNNNKRDQINYKNFNYNINSKKLIYKNKKIHLSPVERRIFELLILNIGQIQTDERLIGSVWGDDEMMFSESLKVHIANLRKKLPINIIENVKGFGYIINDR